MPKPATTIPQNPGLPASASPGPSAAARHDYVPRVPSKWLLRQMEDGGPMPKTLSELMEDKRFVTTHNMRRQNSLQFRLSYLIDQEALEFFLSGDPILPWGTVNADDRLTGQYETRAEAEQGEGRVIPMADFQGKMAAA